MIAALGAYDQPELRAEVDAVWSAIRDAARARGLDAPDALRRHGDPIADPALLLGQTCGWTVATAPPGRLTVVATPCYAAEGCDGPRYRSALLVRADDPARALADLRGRRVAVNAFDSWSGWRALREAAAPLGGPHAQGWTVAQTGAHRASMAAVASGAADLCAVDCVTLSQVARVAPTEASGLRRIGWTAPAPGLPLVTARPDAAQALAEAAEEALASPAADAFGLRGLARLSAADYADMTTRDAASGPG